MQQPESPLRQYLQTLKRQAWLVVLVPALTVAVAVAILQTRDPVYRASMTMVVGQPHGTLPPELAPRSVTRTMTSLLENDLIVRGVIDQLGLDVTVEKFKEDLAVSVLPDTSVMDVSYESTNQRQALQVVEELARIFTRELDETLGVGKGSVSGDRSFELIVRIFDPPHLDPDPGGDDEHQHHLCRHRRSCTRAAARRRSRGARLAHSQPEGRGAVVRRACRRSTPRGHGSQASAGSRLVRPAAAW